MPRLKKSPAFQLYTKDLLSDANVMAMELDEFGAYVKLLAICWNEKGLPTDPDRLAKMLHVSRKKFDGLWNVVGLCFFNYRGKFQQKRLDKERRKQAKFRKSRQINGRKGGRPRGTTSLPSGFQKEPLLSAFALCDLRSTDQERTETTADAVVSSEAKAPSEPDPPASPPVLVYPTVGANGTAWDLTELQLADWRTLFPGVDVLDECRRALAWTQAHPDRRKTSRGMAKFLVSWLSRSTDRPSAGRAAPAGKTAGNTDAARRFVERGAQ